MQLKQITYNFITEATWYHFTFKISLHMLDSIIYLYIYYIYNIVSPLLKFLSATTWPHDMPTGAPSWAPRHSLRRSNLHGHRVEPGTTCNDHSGETYPCFRHLGKEIYQIYINIPQWRILSYVDSFFDSNWMLIQKSYRDLINTHQRWPPQ